MYETATGAGLLLVCDHCRVHAVTGGPVLRRTEERSAAHPPLGTSRRGARHRCSAPAPHHLLTIGQWSPDLSTNPGENSQCPDGSYFSLLVLSQLRIYLD